VKPLLVFNPDRFTGVSLGNQPGREILVTAAELVAGPPDDDAAVGLEPGIEVKVSYLDI
jgi:hypothetical protein